MAGHYGLEWERALFQSSNSQENVIIPESLRQEQARQTAVLQGLQERYGLRFNLGPNGLPPLLGRGLVSAVFEGRYPGGVIGLKKDIDYGPEEAIAVKIPSITQYQETDTAIQEGLA